MSKGNDDGHNTISTPSTVLNPANVNPPRPISPSTPSPPSSSLTRPGPASYPSTTNLSIHPYCQPMQTLPNRLPELSEFLFLLVPPLLCLFKAIPTHSNPQRTRGHSKKDYLTRQEKQLATSFYMPPISFSSNNPLISLFTSSDQNMKMNSCSKMFLLLFTMLFLCFSGIRLKRGVSWKI